MSLVEIKNLEHRYGNHTVLAGLNLTLEEGEIIGLLGPNGVGKTTLMKILCGLIQNYDGSVLVDGQPIGVHSKSVISYLPERTYFRKSENVKSAIGMFRDFYKDFDEKKAMEMAMDLKLDSKQKIGTMSKGMQEKLQLVFVMSRKAKLFVLDDPMGGVDPTTRDYILTTILNQYTENSSILLSTHLVHDVEQIFDRAVFLKQGRVLLNEQVDVLRAETGMSIDQYFREVYR